MGWRLARSLDILRAEVRAVHPGTRVDTIGDQSHASGSSDHNPNSAGVVCAADFFANAGLHLGRFADTIVRTDPPALKYVIYNRRIWHPGYGWSSYRGSNPHTSHVHVSVGVGPDGRSTGPYDNTAPWGVASRGADEMFCRHGDSGPAVKLLQYRLLNCGWKTQVGQVDGDYGDKTAAALKAAMATLGSTVDGRTYGPEEMMRMDIIVARHYGSGQPGPAGAQGPPGPRGEPGPAGDVTATVAGVVAEISRRIAVAGS